MPKIPPEFSSYVTALWNIFIQHKKQNIRNRLNHIAVEIIINTLIIHKKDCEHWKIFERIYLEWWVFMCQFCEKSIIYLFVVLFVTCFRLDTHCTYSCIGTSGKKLSRTPMRERVLAKNTAEDILVTLSNSNWIMLIRTLWALVFIWYIL